MQTKKIVLMGDDAGPKQAFMKCVLNEKPLLTSSISMVSGFVTVNPATNYHFICGESSDLGPFSSGLAQTYFSKAIGAVICPSDQADLEACLKVVVLNARKYANDAPVVVLLAHWQRQIQVPTQYAVITMPLLEAQSGELSQQEKMNLLTLFPFLDSPLDATPVSGLLGFFGKPDTGVINPEEQLEATNKSTACDL